MATKMTWAAEMAPVEETGAVAVLALVAESKLTTACSLAVSNRGSDRQHSSALPAWFVAFPRRRPSSRPSSRFWDLVA